MNSLLTTGIRFLVKKMKRNKIKDMIGSLEPRVGTVKVNVRDNAELNEYNVSVTFNVIGIPGAQTLDFYLERLR